MNRDGIESQAASRILVCTLGASWAVIPEIFGWLAPEEVDLYAHHPQRAALDSLRAEHGLQSPQELWICTSQGEQTRRSLELLLQWWRALGDPLPLRIWSAEGTDQLATQGECAHLRELIWRVVLRASEAAGQNGGQFVLSLAGGRKTMSADLQDAANVFGANACVHVVGPDPLPAPLLGRTQGGLQDQVALFSRPLAADLAAAIAPLVTATRTRSELLDIDSGGGAIASAGWSVPLPAPGRELSWPAPAPKGRWLQDEWHRRQRESGALIGNYLSQLAAAEDYENWRSLYRLMPARIESLRGTRLSGEHQVWLRSLPKADLHRHLGGCLDLPNQYRVAEVIWQASSPQQRDTAMAVVRPLLLATASNAVTDWPGDWVARLRSDNRCGAMRALCSAALLLHASQAQLERNLFGITEPRLALKRRHALGFAAYERPGELSGSAVLGHPAAIAPYAQSIVDQARADGLIYLELRGSPHKYRPGDPAGFLAELRCALAAAGADVGADPAAGGLVPSLLPRIGFVWILDRRQRQDLGHIVAKAVAAHQQLPGFLLGLDLAGDEGTHDPQALAPCFEPAFEACMPITIHAGEGEPAEKIWQAAYHLHADRIGHGLTLVANAPLAARFRDRGICLELCPTSNLEVVGFADPAVPASENLPAYPLADFMRQGLPLTLCTDNPGISRTSLTDEYLAAARMSAGGLSQWQALAIMRQAFVDAFAGAAERQALVRKADKMAYDLLSGPPVA